MHFYFCSPTHLLFISSSSTLTLTKRALDPRHGRLQCVSFFFFFCGHWELPCAPRPTASHDVPPRSAWTACRALISTHVSSPLECAGFLTPKEEQLKSAGSLLLDSYPKNARFGTAMLSYCQNGTQFPCRVRRLHQRLALACPSTFLGRATVARPPQRACQDACRKGTGSAASSPRGSRGGDRGGCFRQVLERVRRVLGERRSFARDTVRSASSLLPSLFSRTLPLPWKDDLVTALSDCAWTNVRRRRTTSRGVGGPTPQFPGTTADDDAERVDNAASRF